jgi:hypothetical protein
VDSDRRESRRGRKRGSRRGALRRYCPTLLGLERRSLLSTFTVNSIADDGSAGTLRWAIGQASASSEADTIAFSSLFNAKQTINLTAGQIKLSDKATTTISGPGANLLTVRAGSPSRVFDLDGASATLSGLTITAGNALGLKGGGLASYNGTFSLTDCIVTGNSSSKGGGLYMSGGSATLTDCTVSGNNAEAGGGLYVVGGSATLTDCTVSGNAAAAGGGLAISGTVALTNCTISGNTGDFSQSTGGGLCINGGAATVTNCTLFGNTATYGGGVFNQTGTATLTNTIVAGNTAEDVQGAVAPGSANNLIGDGSGMSGISGGSQGNQVGTAQAPIAPLLASLGDYGGPTQTLPVLPSSPAIRAGTSGAGIPATDQRGQARAGHADIGAFQSQGFTLTPVAGSTPQATMAGAAFENPLALTVTASNPVEPVDGGVIGFAVTPFGGASATISSATVIVANGQAAVNATANLKLGLCTVSATAAGAAPAIFGLVNTQAFSLVVNTTEDLALETEGQNSLRAAVAYANSLSGPSTITFDPSVFGSTPQKISLSYGQLTLANLATITINGPGVGLLTVSGGGSRVFDLERGSAALLGLTVSGGKADSGAGVSNNGGTLTLTGCAVSDNSAAYGGGGLSNNGGTLTLSNCTITGNSAGSDGGGLDNTGGTLTLSYCGFSGNSSNQGGGLYNTQGKLTLSNCTVSGNSAVLVGGGVRSLIGTLTLSNCAVSDNSAGYGGGLSSSFDTLTLTDCAVTGNTAVASSGNFASPNGGGVNVAGGTVSLVACTVSGNSAAGSGGGLYVFEGATVTLTNATVSGNSTAGSGGGLYASAGGTVTLTNATVSGNSAGSGGGLANDQSTLTLTNTTVTANSAAVAGGLFTNGGTAFLTNTIVAGQTSGGDVIGTITGGSNNLVGDGSGMTGISNGSQGNQVGTAGAPIDPLLAALGDYGGPTPTMPLLPGSPAIGGGTSGAGIPTTDQRGFGRVGVFDIGAFQVQAAALVVNTTAGGAGSDPGQLSLRQAVNLASVLPGAESISFDPAVFGTLQTITLTTGPLVLTDQATITIIGPGASLLTVSGNQTRRVFDVQGGSVALSGLTISGGKADFGAGVYNSGGTLTLSDCTISGSTATSNGGGLCNSGGTLTLTDCTLSDNTATIHGGGLCNSGGTLTLTNCALSGNTAGTSGGGLCNIGGTLTLFDCTLSGNTAGIAGGGLFAFNLGLTTLSGGTVTGNSAGNDGYNSDHAYGGGLGAAIGGSLTLSNVTVSGNSVLSYLTGYSYGGGLISLPGGSLTLSNVTVTGNSAPNGDGAGLDNRGGTIMLTDCTISGNRADRFGGGLDTDGGKNGGGSTTLIDCALIGNGADTGGGLSNRSSTTTLTNCTVSGNLAGADSSGVQGGGLYNGYAGYPSLGFPGGTLMLTGCTVSGNINGGLNQNGSTTALTNTIVAGNSGGDTSGVDDRIFESSSLIGVDPKLAPLGDYGGPTPTMPLLPGSPAIGKAGAVTALWRSGVPDTSTTVIPVANGSVLAASSLPTLTSGSYFVIQIEGEQMAVVGLSLYFDQSATLEVVRGANGTAAAAHSGGAAVFLASDQRGYTRSSTVASDIGAFESQSGIEIIVNTTADGAGSAPGQFSLRQAVNLANLLAIAVTIDFDPTVFATPQTIALSGSQLKLTSKATTTIAGPGANLLTISGKKSSRVFAVYNASAALSGLTITEGNAEKGGGLCNYGGMLTLSDCTISGNSTTQEGGGLATLYGGTVGQYFGTTTLIGCTVSGNTATSGGGLGNEADSTVTLTGCTVSGNSSSGRAGGLDNFDATVSLTNCTLSGNAAGQQGGGLFIAASSLSLTDCTISGDSALSGGGVYVAGVKSIFGPSTTSLTNTIVAGQTSGGDVCGTISGGTNNLIGDGSGMTGISAGSQGNQVGTAQAPIDPLLAALGEYGGATSTMPLLPGSSAIGGGTASGAPTTDQRGQPRTGHVDIGAFQSAGFTLTPLAGSTPQSALVGAAFAHPLAVTVTANNPAEPVDGGAVRFAAPTTGASATLSAATATIAHGQAGVTATAGGIAGSFTVAALAAGETTPAGFALTNTAATLSLAAQPVAAVAGQAFINVVLATFTDSDPNAGPSDFVAAITWGDGITTSSTTVVALGQGQFNVLGTHTYVDAGFYPFSVQVTVSSGASATATSTATVTAKSSTEPRSLILTTHRDVVDAFDGLTSLREAIAYANSHPGPDTITFDPAVFGKAPRTIKLIGGPLLLTDPATTTIVGPGARFLTLSGGRRSQVFDIRGGSLALEGVTISGGRADRGGGVLNHGGTLALDHVILRGNRARVGGGLFNDGKAVLSDVVIRGNRARVGAGLFNTRAATFSWRRPAGSGRR